MLENKEWISIGLNGVFGFGIMGEVYNRGLQINIVLPFVSICINTDYDKMSGSKKFFEFWNEWKD